VSDTASLGARLAHAIAAKVFGSWFEPADEIERVVDVAERGDVADTSHVSYRFDLVNPSGSYVAEQQVYYRGTDTIDHLRVMCSGFRPR
jgi:hypothetical protein